MVAVAAGSSGTMDARGIYVYEYFFAKDISLHLYIHVGKCVWSNNGCES